MRFVQAGVMLLGAALYILVPILLPDGDPDGDGIFDNASNGDFIYATFLGWNALLVIVTILVIIDSHRRVRAGKTRELATGVFIVKLAAIPFFLINFALMALLALGGLATLIHGIGIAFLAVVAISVVLTYLAMLSTSVYGWAAIAQLRNERRFGTVLAVLYTLLLGVFVADIVVGILLFVHYRRGVKSTPQSQELEVVAEAGHDLATSPL